MNTQHKIIGGIVTAVIIFTLFNYVIFGMTVAISHPDTNKWSYYSKNNFFVFYEDCLETCKSEKTVYKKTLIASADPNTFEVLSEKYSKDINNVYLCSHDLEYYSKFKCEIVENADPGTFSSIGTTGGDIYAKDKNYVYMLGKVIENADPLSFNLVGDELINGRVHTYTKDKNYVYRSGEIIKNADSSTFILIYPNTNQDYSYASYAKDKNHVYIFGKLIENADQQTFRLIDTESIKTKNGGRYYRFAVDKNSIYFTDYSGNLYRITDMQSVSDLDYFFSTGIEKFFEQGHSHTITPLIEAPSRD